MLSQFAILQAYNQDHKILSKHSPIIIYFNKIMTLLQNVDILVLKHILNQELFHFLILIIIALRFLLNFLEGLNLGDSRLRLRFLVIIGYGIAVFLAWSPLLLIRICASLAIVTKFMIITLYFLFHLIHFIQIIKKTKQDIQQ